MPSSRRLPVSARKTDVLRMAHHGFITCCSPIHEARSISMSPFADVSTDVEAALEGVLVSLLVQMPHGVLRPS
jgi:hypothetical protein